MEKIIDNNTILKLNKNVLKRFEHNLEDGTMILFNTETEGVWFGNSTSKDLIELIDGNNTVEKIYSEILCKYQDEDFNTVLEALNNIIETLFQKEFVIITNS